MQSNDTKLLITKYKRPIEYFLALDLELNQPSNKIIQVGAVVGNIKTGEVVDKLSCIVNPKETLGTCNDGTTTITQLTGITQEMVDNGMELQDAYLQLVNMSKKWDCFCNPITWGGGDSIELKEQLTGAQINGLISWPFGRRWIDAKTIYVTHRLANDLPPKGGLARACNSFGMPFQGRKHDAMDDAYNTFRIYYKMMKLLENK